MSAALKPVVDTEPPCGGCQNLENPHASAAVQLLDGRTVCTWCPAWAEECAMRHSLVQQILRLPDKPSRHEMLGQHEAGFGKLARDRLEAEVRRQYAERRARVLGEREAS